MARAERTLIVGGGIAGLTLAAALHAQGFAVELIEHNDGWHALGAGMAIQPNAMRALRTLGLDTAVADCGAVLPRWRFCDERGILLYEVDLQTFWHEVGPFVGIERAKLQSALLAGVAKVPCKLATSVVSLRQDNRQVSVAFSDGSAATFDLVVGADGIHSFVRQLAFASKAPVGAGHIAWRSVAPMRPAGLNDLRFFFGDSCFFGLCPTGNGHTYGFGHLAEPHFYDDIFGRLRPAILSSFSCTRAALPLYRHAVMMHCMSS